MRAPGFYDGVGYHSDPESLSVSGAKTLLKAPALFKWQRDHPAPPKDIFDFGTAAHALVLGVGCELVVHECDAEKVKSPKSTAAWKEQQAKVRAAGNVLLLPEEHAAVVAMADRLAEHETATRLLSEGRPEVLAYCPDEATGVMRRGWFDWLGPAILTDYKTAASVEPWAFAGAVAKYGYHMQAAWYLDLARDLGHPAEAFAFICQEKTAPYLVEVYDLDADAIARGRELNRRALERFRDCRESGIWPGYTGRPFTTLSLPRWAHYDNDLENIA